MGIFAVAALAGFLLFGWIKAIQKLGDDFQKLRLQSVLGVIGSLALFVVALFVIVLTTQWPSYEVFRIVQDLTGRETTQFILGAAFGCILRYWEPHFWTVRMRPGTRYNWVAISFAGLLLLASAVPYIDRQFGGMTALKTPVAELQFAGKSNAELIFFEEQREIRAAQYLPRFAITNIQKDLDYLKLFQGETKTIAEPCDKNIKEGLEKTYCYTQDFIDKILNPLQQCALRAQNNYLDTESIRHALSPVAQKLRLLIQSGQSQNSTPAEKLSDNLLIKIKQSVNRLKEALVQDKDLPLKEVEKIEQSVNRLKEALVQDKDLPLEEVEKIEQSVNRLKEALVQDKDLPLEEVEKIEQSVNRLKEALVQDKDLPLEEVEKIEQSVNRLKEALVQDKDLPLEEVEKIEQSVDFLKNMCPLGNLESLPTPEVLANTPHIYLVQAFLDGFNENREGAISILKAASKQFGDDHSPGILFNINFFLALFLYDSEYNPESIFPYLDKALEIVKETLDRIDKRKQRTIPLEQCRVLGVDQCKLLKFSQDKLLEAEKRFENAERLAKNSLAYFSAEVGVRKTEALQYAEQNYVDRDKLAPSLKINVIDTLGYVKMAFAARREPPNFDEIEQAKALFQEALSHLESLPRSNRQDIESKRTRKKTFQAHLEQANRLLASR